MDGDEPVKVMSASEGIIPALGDSKLTELSLLKAYSKSLFRNFHKFDKYFYSIFLCNGLLRKFHLGPL